MILLLLIFINYFDDDFNDFEFSYCYFLLYTLRLYAIVDSHSVIHHSFGDYL